MVTCVAVLALASGCGDETAPGEAVPALAARLDRVDQAIAAGDYPDATAQLDRLVAETARAEVAGQITDEQADRILKAVEAVLAGLPAAEEDSDGSPPAAPSPEPEPPADEESPDEEKDEDEEKDDKKDDKKDKDKKKDED